MRGRGHWGGDHRKGPTPTTMGFNGIMAAAVAAFRRVLWEPKKGLAIKAETPINKYTMCRTEKHFIIDCKIGLDARAM